METKLESLTRPEDLRTAAFKFRKNNPSSVSHDSAAMYIELSADRIEQLRQRVAEFEKERDRLSELCDKWNFECDEMREDNKRLANVANALKQQRDELVESLRETLDFVERHSNRWDGVNGKHPFTVVEAARAAIASVKEK